MLYFQFRVWPGLWTLSNNGLFRGSGPLGLGGGNIPTTSNLLHEVLLSVHNVNIVAFSNLEAVCVGTNAAIWYVVLGRHRLCIPRR